MIIFLFCCSSFEPAGICFFLESLYGIGVGTFVLLGRLCKMFEPCLFCLIKYISRKEKQGLSEFVVVLFLLLPSIYHVNEMVLFSACTSVRTKERVVLIVSVVINLD